MGEVGITEVIKVDDLKNIIHGLLGEIEKARMTHQKIRLDETTLLWCKYKIKKWFGIDNLKKSI